MGKPVTAWSYSKYADYKQCPQKFKFKHIDRLPDPPSPAMERGNQIHKAAEQYVGRELNTPPKLLTSLKGWDQFAPMFEEVIEMDRVGAARVLVEQKWGFTDVWTDSPWSDFRRTWFRAILDLGLIFPDRTATIIDYKSGKQYETNEEQIELFALAAMCHDPRLAEVEARLWYLDSDRKDAEIVRTFSAKDRENLIEKWEKKVRPLFADQRYAPRPNERCHWCPYSKAKGGPCKAA